jgi:phosphoribosylglycinamide formyltransferase-1
MKLGVLVSGSGSNLQALLDAEANGLLAPGEIACVISNKPGVRALDRATAAGKPAIVVDHRGYPGREAFEDALLAALAEHGVTPAAGGVVLAGFMRLLTPHFVDRFRDRMLNIHPSLLPAFPGAHAQQQALDYGVTITGCTVHLVDVEMDAGPIVAQTAVPVLPSDDVDSLTARILTWEHVALPRAVQLLAAGCLKREGRRVRTLAP